MPFVPAQPLKVLDDGLGGAYNTWALSAFTADIIDTVL